MYAVITGYVMEDTMAWFDAHQLIGLNNSN